MLIERDDMIINIQLHEGNGANRIAELINKLLHRECVGPFSIDIEEEKQSMFERDAAQAQYCG